jgi:hypothetical protein
MNWCSSKILNFLQESMTKAISFNTGLEFVEPANKYIFSLEFPG